MLTDLQIANYRELGYTVCPEFLDPGEIAAFISEIGSICAGHTQAAHDKTRLEMEPHQPPDGTRVRRIYEPCTFHVPIRDLSESGKLLDVVEQLLGPDLDFHYSKINMKPQAIGSVVEWHQDLTYYPLTNDSSVSILIYLDDTRRENGCLEVLPARHQGPPLNHTRNGIFQGKVTEALDTSAAVPLEGGAGTAIFMHCLTPHASALNRSARPRRTLILSYRAADAFPIYAAEVTPTAEGHVRHVRGRSGMCARFSFDTFPIPRYPRRTASLYELQELSREELQKE